MQAGILGVPACFLIYQAMKHMKNPALLIGRTGH